MVFSFIGLNMRFMWVALEQTLLSVIIMSHLMHHITIHIIVSRYQLLLTNKTLPERNQHIKWVIMSITRIMFYALSGKCKECG